MTTFYLGIDPSLRNTGIAVWDDTFNLVYQTTIHTHADGNTCTPYVEIVNGITHVLRSYNISAAFTEEMFQSRSTYVTKCLYRAQFAAELACYNERVACFLVKPTEWQRAILGAETKLFKGLTKVETRRRVERDLDIKFSSEHSSDAACIALAGINIQFNVNYFVEKNLPEPLKELPRKPKPKRKKNAPVKKLAELPAAS